MACAGQAAMMKPSRIPVTVLTGFLGSGKTTLLRRLLEDDGGRNVAVLINEFGEIGLDHLIVRAVTDSAVVLQNGCICCTIRSDLRQAFRDLIDGRSRGDVPPFESVLLETTGLADPLPIVQTIARDPMLSRQLRLGNIVTTIDALNGGGSARPLRGKPEPGRRGGPTRADQDGSCLTGTDRGPPRDTVGAQSNRHDSRQSV